MTQPPDRPEAKIDVCAPRPPEALGLTCCERDHVSDGLTLCHSNERRSATLIDIDGSVVHAWSLDRGPRWHECQLLDTGNLLVAANENAYSAAMNSRHWLIELDPDSQIVWESSARCHHDMQRLPNGNTLVACNGHAHYPEVHARPLIYDYIEEINPEGKIAWVWHYGPHEHQLGTLDIEVPPGLGDWPHINTVESLPDTPAGRSDPRFREGNILVSPRHIHRIFVVDRDSGDIVWQWGEGILRGQHQPTMLPGGTILLFDNGWGPPMRGWSQVLEVDPVSEEIVWSYRADPVTDFWSPVGSGAQRLPNNNTLICSMNWDEPGRIFEVTTDGTIVWEYWNPEGRSFYRAYRYQRDSPNIRSLNRGDSV